MIRKQYVATWFTLRRLVEKLRIYACVRLTAMLTLQHVDESQKFTHKNIKICGRKKGI